MRRALVLGLFASLLLSSTATAQKKRAVRKGESAPPAAEAQTSSADDEVARGLFQAGKAAYQAGKYQDALSFFEQSHARSGRPELLFNIGQAAERVRQDQKALEMFRAYLTQVPDAANRVEVEARIKQLEQWVAEQDKAAAPLAPIAIAIAPTPAETAEQAPSAPHEPAYTEADSKSAPVTEKWWFWTGIGAVVLGGTAVALAVALSGDETEREPFYEGNGGTLPGP